MPYLKAKNYKDIDFPVQDTDTKFQTVSQKNQGVTSD
jgi:hypothetical protein